MSLARVYRAEGQAAEAAALPRRALAIREAALGPDHPDVGTVMERLGEALRDAGHTVEAVALAALAASIRAVTNR
ncbi:MAG: tetratricopeptide repeat protein [Alphaproteobacteria bacterium]|nr:tetratricopeptide repeat protein [Alphaproteobacteria bacterium]